MNRFALAAWTLWQREVVRFYRQKSRVIGAVLPPVIFWFLIGSGLGGSFRHGFQPGAESMNYLEYFFPGTIVMIVLFTAVFSTISIIEDRREGFLQSVLVAPVSRNSIVMGKILGGATLAFAQALIFLCAAPFLSTSVTLGSLIYVLVILFATAFGLTGLGFIMAWRMDSTQGFHSIMNLFLMPMWFLSGSLFPVDSAPRWLKAAMLADPLTYSVAALRHGLYAGGMSAIPSLPSPVVCLLVTVGFCILTFAVSSIVCARREIG